MSDINIVPFDFKGNSVRTAIVNGEPWFIAKDVCAVLGIVNISDACGKLRESQKLTIGNTDSRSNSGLLVVSEAGLYALLFKSRKKEAEAFQDWVCEEVLPSIRKTGSYSVSSEPAAEANPEERKPLSTFLIYTMMEEMGQLQEPEFVSHMSKLLNAQLAARVEPKGVVTADTPSVRPNRATVKRFVAPVRNSGGVTLIERAKELGYSFPDRSGELGLRLAEVATTLGFWPVALLNLGSYDVGLYDRSDSLDKAIVQSIVDGGINKKAVA